MTRRVFGNIRRLPSKRYQASYAGPDGRRHVGWSTYLIKADAEHWLREEELLIDSGRWTPPARRRPVDRADLVTLRGYSETVIGRRVRRARKPLRPTTADLYRKLLRLAILPDLGDLPLVDLTPDIIARWHDRLPADQPTQNGNAYQLLRSILNDAVDDELIATNPCRIKGAGKPTPRHKGEALNVGELGVYLAHIPERMRLPLMLAAWCGLRSGEARALRLRDLAPDGSAVRVERTVTRILDSGRYVWHFGPPKTQAGVRTVAVPPHLRPVVVAWLDAHDADPDDLAFPALDGRSPLNSSTFHEAHKLAAKAIGRPSLTIHDLRRTGATLAGQTGSTVRELMAFLGHTQPGVAMVYQVATADRDALRARRMSELASEDERPALTE